MIKENLRIDCEQALYIAEADAPLTKVEGEALENIQRNIKEYGLGFFEYFDGQARFGYLIEPKEPSDDYIIVRSQNNSNCFGCGVDNNIGLGLNFIVEKADFTSHAWLTPSNAYEGWSGVIHGGIITLLLDEAMAKSIASSGVIAVTGNLKVAFKKPVYVGKRIEVRGSTISRTGKKNECEGIVLDCESGEILASANALFITINL